MMDYSERRMRAGLRQLPEGRYEYEDFLEGDGISDELIKLRVAVVVADDGITFDFAGTSDTVAGPLNCRWPSVAACVFFVIKSLIDPELPPNAGAYRPIQIRIPDGSLLSATYPAAVCNANLLTCQRIVDVLLGAFLQAIPERVTAASSGTMNNLNIGGIDPRGGRYFSYVETYAGGQGACHYMDGMDAVQNGMTNTRNAPIEAIEPAYPLLVEEYALVPDSEGAGRYRGGVGVTRCFRFVGEKAKVTLSTDRMRIGPWGVDGGSAAQGARCIITRRSGEVIELPSKVTTSLEQGDCIRIFTPGGGGWGDPQRRDRQAVERDVAEGLVSQERARSEYGLEIE
jgi:N-methylhydantoinase B